MPLIIEPGNVKSTIHFDDSNASSLKNTLDWGLKVEVPGAKFTWDYKSGAWDGKARLWEMTEDRDAQMVLIRSGLLPRLIGLLDKAGVAWRPGIDCRNLPATGQLKSTQVKLRPYQFDAVRASFSKVQPGFGWWPRGVLEVATGGGKTEIAVAMYEMNPVPTMFLVHRKDLLIQAKERFESYGHDVGIIGAGKFEPRTGITIATLQTVRKLMQETDFSNKKAVRLAEMMVNECQQVFFDECHLMATSLIKANEFVEVADAFNVPFRWGLTATPFKRTQFDNMMLEGVTGSSLYTISTKKLVDLGFLTPPTVYMRNVPGVIAVPKIKGRTNKAIGERWRAIEDKGIKFNEIRTKVICEEIKKGPFPVLILVKTTEQANFIQGLHIKIYGETIQFLSGKDNVKTRRAAIAGMRDGSIKAIIATTIFDEGVDIPELKKVILASGGKSQVKVIQRVGRAVRLASGKTEAMIVDFKDTHNPTLKRHAAARRKVYREQEFDVVEE